MFDGILLSFLLICLAEIGDKTQLALLVLSSRTVKPIHLFFGAFVGFCIVDGVAVLAGSFVTQHISSQILHNFAGIIFLFFGIVTLFEKQQKEIRHLLNHSPFTAGFLLLFLTEWGDKTQIVSLTLAIKYSLSSALIGVFAAFFVLAMLTVYIGNSLGKRLNTHNMKYISSATFIVLGVLTLLNQ